VLSQLWLRWGSLLLLTVSLWQLVTMTRGTRWTWGRVIRRGLSGQIGAGTWHGSPNAFDFSRLEPGDIVIGGNPGASWGHYTHATLYLGEGQVMETLLRQGVSLGPVTRYNDYTWAGALRVRVPAEVRAAAVAAARRLAGLPFYLLAPRRSPEWFYCSKIVWWAYRQAGVDLDPAGGFWMVPDRFFQCDRIEPLRGTPPPPAVGP